MQRITKYKKYILGIIGILLALTMVAGFKYLMKSKYEELPEVKLKEKINKNKYFAIMVQNEDGNGYNEYQDNSWPSSGYKFKEAKCVDNNGVSIENAIIFDSVTKTVILETDKTVSCTLYFDILFNGKGTKDNPYKINFIEDLVDLQVAVSNGESYAGKYFTLEKNLDFNVESDYQNYQSEEYGDINGVGGIEGIKDELTNKEGSGFIPIGLSNAFSGNIDGKNNKISNLYIYNTKNEDQKLAFIGKLLNGSISNLTISGEVKTTGSTPLGGLVNNISNSTIDNCTNEVNVTSNKGGYAVGGLVGWSSGDATIKNSTNRGSVTNGGYTGGILAGNQGGTLTIENCKNYGKIENNIGYSLGGIVSETVNSNAKKSIIKNSVNYGEIKANNTGNINIYAGGIFGRSSKELEITNSNNEGVVDINGTSYLYVGGIIGNSQNILNISNSYNLGEINSSTSGAVRNKVGGLIGGLDYSDITKISKIENSYNKGNINGGDRTGGLLGELDRDSKLIINKCYNTGTIINGKSDTDYNYAYSIETGGIIGQVWDGPTVYILNSYNQGEIINNPKNVSGHAGGIIFNIEDNSYRDSDYNKKSNGYIINSYNKGKITAKGDAMGISGINNISTISLNNVYNIGEINGSSKAEIINVFSTGEVKSTDNVYYKEGLVASNKSLSGFYSLTDENMKNTTLQDNNSLIYKLNQNVININKSGLTSLDKDTIGTDLDGYTLVDWIIDPITGYPTLNYNLES